jgi:hypothetical protein
MTLLAAGTDSPVFSSYSEKTDWVRHYLTGWDISGSSAEPVLYPTVPKGNTLFIEDVARVINAKTSERYATKDMAANSIRGQ